MLLEEDDKGEVCLIALCLVTQWNPFDAVPI